MQYPKDPIRSRILQAAEGVFRQKGFARATMREIAARAGIGTSNLYNYFAGKDELFRTLVLPVTQELHRLLERHHGANGTDILRMFDEDYIRQETEAYIALISAHRTRLHLLFFRAEGSSLERFREEFAERSTTLVQAYFGIMRQRHPQLSLDFTPFSIHLHTMWMFALMEEIIVQRIRPREVRQVVTEYMQFETRGWRELMKR